MHLTVAVVCLVKQLWQCTSGRAASWLTSTCATSQLSIEPYVHSLSGRRSSYAVLFYLIYCGYFVSHLAISKSCCGCRPLHCRLMRRRR